jgi:hypothetical protein
MMGLPFQVPLQEAFKILRPREAKTHRGEVNAQNVFFKKETRPHAFDSSTAPNFPHLCV